MRRLFYTLLTLTLILAACVPAADSNDGSVSYPNVSYPNASYPNSEENPAAMPVQDYAPQPGDAALTRGNVYLESTDLLTLESFPLQFMLQLKGNLPTPCNALRVVVSPPDADNKVFVDVYSVTDPNKVCAQVIQPFDVNIPLGSFSAGAYTLWVNDEQVAEFQG